MSEICSRCPQLAPITLVLAARPHLLKFYESHGFTQLDAKDPIFTRTWP